MDDSKHLECLILQQQSAPVSKMTDESYQIQGNYLPDNVEIKAAVHTGYLFLSPVLSSLPALRELTT